MSSRIRELFHEIMSLSRVNVSLGGGESARLFYEVFESRHPRYKIIKRKTIGVALLQVPESIELFLKGKSKQVLRTNTNRAKKSGYKCLMFDSNPRIGEMLEINRSSAERQGHEMADEYLDQVAVERYCRAHPSLLGVFSGTGKLVAYLEPIESGEVVITNRLLGHHEHLREGIMYLLISGCVELCVQRNADGKNIHWIMYDMMLGAKPGLRYFKERAGFSPYRVHWTLTK